MVSPLAPPTLACAHPSPSQLRDSFLSRTFIRLCIASLDAVAPLSLLCVLAAVLCYPAPPAVVFTTSLPPDSAADLLLRFRTPLRALTAWCAAEVAWWLLSKASKLALDRRWWGHRAARDEITSEERWRLWRSMVESTRDPWDWMGGAFLPRTINSAPRGAEDPALKKVRIEQVGRTNVEEFIAHFMFNARLRDLQPKSLDRAELHSMILLLEAQITLSRPGAPPFHFLRGRSPHRVFQLSDEPLSIGHHPLVFYAAIAGISQISNFALFAAGFRYYGATTSWPFPPFFMRSSRRSLERLLDPLEASRMGSPLLASRVGYWMKPASARAQEDDAKPLVFAHGISGTFVTVPFLLALAATTGRAVFLPELPYISLRLSPPSAILTRLEYVAAVRRMLWAHGFGLTSLEADEDDEDYDEKVEDEEWRRAKAIVVAHSFGSGAAAWLLRDAPDIVAGTVLIDPMSFLLFGSDTSRNFFRSKCRTAGERFFRYFAVERGINHFLSRHLRWSDSVLFAPSPPAPLPPLVVDALVPKCAKEPLEPPFDVPFYAPWVTPLPHGPVPSVVFLSENDCILPVRKMRAYLEAAGFSTGAAPPASAPAPPSENGKLIEHKVEGAQEEEPDVEAASENGSPASSAPSSPSPSPTSGFPSLHIMPRFEHGAILSPALLVFSSGREWVRRVARAIDEIEKAAERWERMEV
ncbi:hypothetical protein Rhopal_005257-T1 [Rhodotorula paludigena]|uniref:Proteophosphoglycan ppg4 n=1 Tax=Rhodotorula paludigena TaxID=86838 RepID=A0AAV5GT76_9BASI|nr:hypothetical protein Rhopal_005257-T1 [Rhodotorula paludigena]